MSIRTSTTSARALLTLGALAWPAAGWAYRPFDSTDAAVAAEGEAELELGPIGLERVGSATTLFAPSLILNWGIASGWEVVLEGRQAFALGNDVSGSRYRLEDTALNLKGVLRQGCLQEHDGPSVATEVGILLPTVNAEPGAGAQGTLILSQRWEFMTLHVNGQVAWTRDHEPGLLGGLIIEGPEAWPVRPVAEVIYGGGRGGPTQRSALAGAIWPVREGLAIDAALKVARVGGEDVVEVRAGLTWAFRLGVPR